MMYQAAAAETSTESPAEVLKVLNELDELRLVSEPDHARCRAQSLCAQLKDLCQAVPSASLPDLANVVAGCCDLRTQDAQSDIGILEDAVALLKLFPGLLQSKHALDHSEADKVVGMVMRSICNGVLPRLYNVQAFEQLQAASAFDRLLESGFVAMQCITDCTSTVCHALCRALPEGTTEGFAQSVSCVSEWITALAGMATQVVATSRMPGIPNELRTGKTLTKTWHELLRAVDASPEMCRHQLGTSANGALSLAWKQLMASIEVFVTGSVAQQPNNERLYRFWVQKCAHIANSVPSSIGEMAERIWRCTHGVYAVSSLAPAVPGLRVPQMQGTIQLTSQDRCQHQWMVMESMRKHLLPRMLSCALPALSVMPEAVLHLSLQDLCPCVSRLDCSAPQNIGPMSQFLQPDVAAAAARAGGHALLLRVFEELPRVDQRVRDACCACHMFPALCRSLSSLHSSPGSAAVMHDATTAQLAADIGQYMHARVSTVAGGFAAGGGALSDGAATGGLPEERAQRASADLQAFARLCGSMGGMGHQVAAQAAQRMCHVSPACAGPLGELLCEEMRCRCEAAVLAHGVHAFAEHWLAAVACAMVAMRLPGKEGGAAGLQHAVRQIAAREEVLGNPVDCAVVAAGLAACEVQGLGANLETGRESAAPGRAVCGHAALLPVAEQRRLFEQACAMLPWLCGAAENADGRMRAMVVATATALALLLAVMAGALLPGPGEAVGEPEGGLCLELPEAVCCAAVKLCDAGNPEPARAASIMMLTAACEEQSSQAAVACIHDALSKGCLPVSAAGLVGRALTAAAGHPSCTPQQHAAQLALWRELLSACSASADPLTAALRWFVVFARVFPSNEYTQAVPAALLHATSAAHGTVEPHFLQLMKAAQLSVRPGGSRLLVVKAAVAAGTSDSPDVMEDASGSGKHARAACVAAALQCDLVALSQGAAPVNAAGLGTDGGPAAGMAAGVHADGSGGLGRAGERSAALRDVLNTLQQLHAAEIRDGGAMAGGIHAACQELQAAVQAGARAAP